VNIYTQIAINAFREAERVSLLLDQKKKNLDSALNGRIDTSVYFEETEKIRAQFQEKRERKSL
jgi:hypothetical protein